MPFYIEIRYAPGGDENLPPFKFVYDFLLLRLDMPREGTKTIYVKSLFVSSIIEIRYAPGGDENALNVCYKFEHLN